MNKEITESGDKLEKTPEDMDINNTQAEERRRLQVNP